MATPLYPLSLHDALPILVPFARCNNPREFWQSSLTRVFTHLEDCDSRRMFGHRYMNFFEDRKSTRLNSSHVEISYAVFCLKKNHQVFVYTNHRTETFTSS